MDKQIGFLEKESSAGTVEKSSTNLSMIVGVGICVLAAVTETATQLLSLNNETFHEANWMGIAALCAAILVGGGAAKLGRNHNSKVKADV